MRILFASPLGFLIGVTLGAVGGGGSILAVPMLVYGAGLPPKKATTASLVIVLAVILLRDLDSPLSGASTVDFEAFARGIDLLEASRP